MEDKRKYTKEELAEILEQLGISGVCVDRINAFVSDEDGFEYSVWKVDAADGPYVLKLAKGLETEVYRSFFAEKKPYAPELFASCGYDGKTFLLMEYCPGEDLRICSREKLVMALDALILMQDEFWERIDLSGCAVTMERALASVEDRGKYLGSALLEEAYAKFVRAYRAMPRTLCHEDLLPINVLAGDRAVLIDWEYGGMLPYLSSFARLIAHGRGDKDAFFYMTAADKEFAVGYYYENLVKKHGIPYAEYRDSLDLFLFYEYCEWVMLGNRCDGREDERYGYYLKLAGALAAELSATGR